jgi:uracil-DNA glycosylase
MTRALKQRAELDSFFTGFGITKLSPQAEQKLTELLEKTKNQPAEPVQNILNRQADSEAAKNLEEIAEQVAECCCCSLGKTRTNPVPGQGNPNARVVFVGEAPGADEDAAGIPFVGRAGQLLDKIIAAMGLSRNDVFICNILKCRPPGNRNPKTEEVHACIGYLIKQLKAINPEIIVALGAYPAQNLLGTTEAIGRLRGRFHDYQPAPDMAPIKLMPTYHPAYLLRNYTRDARAKVWQDIQKVMGQLNLPAAK